MEFKRSVGALQSPDVKPNKKIQLFSLTNYVLTTGFNGVQMFLYVVLFLSQICVTNT